MIPDIPASAHGADRRQDLAVEVTHISKAGADRGTDRSIAWAFDLLSWL
jgi:hypothetical protein